MTLNDVIRGKSKHLRLVPRTGSTELVIAFSHLGYPSGHFAMSRALADLSVNILYVNSGEDSWYQRGLGEEAPSIDATLELLKQLIEHLDPTKIICVGISMGGYAALLFGLLLKCDIILAITAEITIGETFSRSWTANTLQRYDARYRSLAYLIQQNSQTKIFAIYGAYDIIDLSLLWPIAREIEHGDTLKLFMVSGDHKIAVNLPVRSLVDALLRDGKLTFRDIHETLAFAERPDAEELYSFAFIKKYEDEPDKSILYQALKDLPSARERSWMCLFFGKILFDCKRFQEAEEVFLKGVKLDPHSHSLWHSLGLNYQANHEHEKASESYAIALAIRPEATITRMRYANALAALGNFIIAESEYRRVLQQAPHLVEAQAQLAKLLEATTKSDAFGAPLAITP